MDDAAELVIEPLQMGDFAHVAEWLNNAESNRWLYAEWRENVVTERLLAFVVNSPKNKLWCFRVAGQAYGLGAVTGISSLDRSGLVWYLRGSEVDRQPGMMTAAVGRMVRKAFVELGLHSLTASVHRGNRASEKLLRKVGFREVGIMREAFSTPDGFVDRMVFDLLETDAST